MLVLQLRFVVKLKGYVFTNFSVKFTNFSFKLIHMILLLTIIGRAIVSFLFDRHLLKYKDI